MDSEFEIQSYVSTRLKRLGVLHHGDQNSGKRGPKARAQMKASGACKGWPDMCVVLPPPKANIYPNPGKIVFLEFKTIKGKLSKEQQSVLVEIKSCGIECYVVQEKTKEDAWQKVETILGL